MNDSPFTTHGDEPVEARIVSWVLGEASAFEAAELERLCEERPELMVFKRRMLALHGLLTEAESARPDDDKWRLPPEKRKAVDVLFGEQQPIRLEVEKEKRIRHSGRRVFLAIAACVVITLFITQLQPWKQTSEAILEVKPRAAGMTPLGAEMSESSGNSRMTPQFFGTEHEKIKSRQSLEKVVDNLDLDKRWNMDKKDAVAKLKDSIKTENIRGTDMLKIQVRRTDKKEADEITREVAYAYKDYREQLEKNEAERQLSELNKAVQDQEDKVEERRKVLATIVRNKGIIYKGQDSFYNSGGVDEDSGARNAQQVYHEIEQEKKQLESQVKSLLKYNSDDLMVYAGGLNLPENPVRELYPKYQEAKRQLDGLKISGLADNHPTVKTTVDQVESTKRQLDEGVVNLRATLQAQLDLASNRLKSVEIMKDDEREEAIKRGLDAQDYANAKRDFENDQQLLQTMKLKQVGETISRKASSESVVIHEVPGSKSSKSETQALASNSLRTRRLETALPNELIEGTPKPMNVPNLEAPADGPAGSTSWSMAGSSSGGRVANEPSAKPARQPAPPSSSMAKVVAANTSSATSVPVPDVDVSASSLDFGAADAFAAGVDGGGENSELAAIESDAKPADSSVFRSPGARIAFGEDENGRLGELRSSRRSADPTDAKATEAEPFAEDGLASREQETKTGSGALSYYSSGVMPADELVTGGNRSGIDSIKKSSIDGILRRDVQGAGELASNAEKQQEEVGASPADESAPVLGGLFSSNEKNDHSGNRDYDSTVTLSGKNTYTGGTTVTGGALGIGGSSGVEKNVPPAKPATFGMIDGDESVRSNSELADAGRKDEKSNLKPETPAEGKSEFLSRNAEIGKSKAITPDAAEAQKELREALKDMEAIKQLAMVTNLDELKLKAEVTLETLETDPANAKARELLKKISGLDKQAIQKKAQTSLTDLVSEIPASVDPYSTFSLNISDASFQVAQAALAKGERPDPAGIKVEQFYNAVDYGDPAPSANEPVAVNIEQSAHPVIPGRNLVRVALKTAAAGRSAAQPLRLTLLVDQSGSMVREDRRAAMDKALAGLSELLTQNDLVTVIGFSRTPRLLADGMTGDKAGKLADLINQSASEGGTNLEEAIKLAEQMASRQKLAGAQNRIVLFTDGAANLGNADPIRLAEHVKQLRQKGIAFDIAGIAADGLNDELLGELARNGNGRYYVVGKGGDDHFAKQLAGAFRPAAENVKVQVRFNPERVGRYKLIGFEKDRLKTEDFRNDRVDAAELAADEAGVAIYQVETLPEGNGELGEVSVRFRDTTRGEMIERAWTIPHDAAAPAIDGARPSMQLAVLAMLAGEKLKGGPLADAIDFKQFVDSIAEVRHFYGGDGRVGGMLRVVDALK